MISTLADACSRYGIVSRSGKKFSSAKLVVYLSICHQNFCCSIFYQLTHSLWEARKKTRAAHDSTIYGGISTWIRILGYFDYLLKNTSGISQSCVCSICLEKWIKKWSAYAENDHKQDTLLLLHTVSLSAHGSRSQ